MSVAPEEFEQHYPSDPNPAPVWVFCRLCRCRMQLRTVATYLLPFRCFCGASGTLARFDVFLDEDRARTFAATFEEIYQTTKTLLAEAEMPMPRTAIYKPGEIARIKAGLERPDSAEEELPREAGESAESPSAIEDANSFHAQARQLGEAVTAARDVLERHEALANLGRFAYARRGLFPDARAVAYQACEAAVGLATDVVREATRRHRAGQRVTLKFPLFKRLVALLAEDKQIARAIEVATKAVALGIPGYEERVQKLRAQL